MDYPPPSRTSSLPPTVPEEQSSITSLYSTSDNSIEQTQLGSIPRALPPPRMQTIEPENGIEPLNQPSTDVDHMHHEPERSINGIISWLSSFRSALNSPTQDTRTLEIRAAGLETALKEVQEERSRLRDELFSIKQYSERNQKKWETELMAMRTTNQKLKENIAWYNQKMLTEKKTYRPRHLQETYVNGAQQLQSDIESWSAGIQFTDINVVSSKLLQQELNKLGSIAKTTMDMSIVLHSEFQVPFIRHLIALILFTLLLKRHCPDMSAETSSAIQHTEERMVVSLPGYFLL